MTKKVVKKKATKKKTPAKKHPVKIVKKVVTTTTTPIKSTSKKKTAKKSTTKKTKLPKEDLKIEKALIDNFVGLQKVMVNLSAKFDDLTNKISKLLDLFEISAKALAEKDLTLEKTSRDDEAIMKKIDNLSEQNKVIARGLTLMHNRLADEPEYPEPETHHPPMSRIPNQKPFQTERKIPEQNKSTEGYQRSIFSKPQTFKKLPR